MNVEKEILLLLKEAYPKALPLRSLSLHVYNMRNTLFDKADAQHVYKSVGDYLRKMSRQSDSPVSRCETKGWYILNPESSRVQQLVLDFTTSEEDEWMM